MKNLKRSLENMAKYHKWMEELTEDQCSIILELMENAHSMGYHEGREDGEERGYFRGINDARDEMDCNCH